MRKSGEVTPVDTPQTTASPISASTVVANVLKAPMPSTYEATALLQLRQRNFPWVRITLRGKSYFEAPDRLAVKFDKVPTYMRSLPEAYAKMLNVALWPEQYTFSLGRSQIVNDHSDFALDLTPKAPPISDRGVALINPTNWTIEQVRWSLSGGVDFNMSEAYQQIGFYRLPVMQTLTVHTPYATADGIARFSDFVLNIPIDNRIFTSP